MTTWIRFASIVLVTAVLAWPSPAAAQQFSAVGFTPVARDLAAQQTPAPQAQAAVERTVRRFGIGVTGGVALDPELIAFGAHGRFGPIFSPAVMFRPGIQFGVGEITTTFAIDLDVLYTLAGAGGERWMPYVGAGPNFGLSHVSFNSADQTTDQRNRFDFSDTDFDGGFNFIAGARRDNGFFFELKATAYGISNVRLLAGYNF